MTDDKRTAARDALARLREGNDVCGDGRCLDCAAYGGADNPRGEGCEEHHDADYDIIEAALKEADDD